MCASKLLAPFYNMLIKLLKNYISFIYSNKILRISSTKWRFIHFVRPTYYKLLITTYLLLITIETIATRNQSLLPYVEFMRKKFAISALFHSVESWRCGVTHEFEWNRVIRAFLNGISVNVYTIEEKLRKTVAAAADDKKESHVNLLYLSDMTRGNIRNFACICLV